jgi:hypothetical protein
MGSTSSTLRSALRWATASAILGATALTAQPQSGSGLWRDVVEQALGAPAPGRRLTTSRHRTVVLDRDRLDAILSTTPMERTPDAQAADVRLELPWPDGGTRSFRIEESPVMEPALALQFPELKTYRGQGIDDATASLRFDVTPAGFHAMVLSADGTVYIDPYAPGDVTDYVSYFFRDYERAGGTGFTCGVNDAGVPRLGDRRDPGAAPQGSFGTQLRTYRLALAATGEYSAVFGGTVPNALSAITTTMNRVNGLYERDIAVHMTMVANETSIIYTNGATDPYTNNSGSTMLNENQTNLDAVIGTANYDIGHVFSTGGAGIATLNSPCDSTLKARGVTGSPTPSGDGFDVDYVAHEMGHQFGAHHTFNGTTSNCGFGNRTAAQAYEPGSGSSIMAYAGICGAEDLQAHSDPQMHAASQSEIIAFITGAGNACATVTATGNTPPTVNAGADFTIPMSTPFTLTATSFDPDFDIFPLYSWEEFDLGTAAPPNTDDGSRPIFRSFPATILSSRTFPKMSDILVNTSTFGESLPTTTRTMTFRVTARDNHIGSPGGGTSSDDMVLNVTAGAGPFVVTQPNTAVSWATSSSQTVTWNVANTTAAPVSTANVKISLSTNGGSFFGTVLAASTPNDGSEAITVPNTPSTTARIKVEAVGNVFFDISNTNFTITAGATAAANMTSPANGSTLTASSQLFQWDAGSGVTQYVIWAGTTGVASSDIAVMDRGTNQSATVTGLPTNGSTVYVRLWSLISGNWQNRDYTYTALEARGQITSPVNGSTLTSSSQLFQWSAGTGASQYVIWAGTTGAGSSNIAVMDRGTNLSGTVTGLPTNGGAIYVRLWTLIGASWLSLDYTYTAAGPGVGTWTALTNQPGVAVNNPLLLTDGTVIVQQALTNNWKKLTPNSSGSYVNGTWSNIASMPAGYNPLYFASAVLGNGKVVVTGGEYLCVPGCSAVWTSLGATYDPATNVWTALAAPGFTLISGLGTGDAQSVVLPDGRFMIGYLMNTQMATLNPTTLAWTVFTAPGKADRHNEENWTLMPEGSVLTVNAFLAASSEKYVIASNTWVTAGSTIVDLREASSAEIGPQVLRPNGTVFVAGSTLGTGPGHSAIYTPGASATAPGSWVAGPDFVTVTGTGYGAKDAPAALLPNGNVLTMISPGFNAPSRFYEWDGASLAQAPNTPRAGVDPAYVGVMLVLPTGQVLLTDQSGDVEVYTPSGTFNDAWRPTITSVPSAVQPSTTYTVSGTQFNGLSQGAAYGDDAQSATNYPIVRITNRATGHIFYCKTHDHSTMGVATGSATVSTSFDVPASIETGNSDIEVVANGIPSAMTAISVGNAAATMTSPANGATLTASSQLFSWTTGTGVTQYVIWAGTTGAGSSNILVLDRGANTSGTVTGLPTNGSTIYIRLWSLTGGTWINNDYTYTAVTSSAAATMTSPGNGATLTSASQTFTWGAAAGATQYYVWLGSTGAGSSNLGAFDRGTNLSAPLGGLPTNGSTLYVRLWSLIGGTWLSNDYAYTTVNLARMTSPANGTAFTNSTITFNWSAATGATQYYLWVGSSAGVNDLAVQDRGTNLNGTVSSLPVDGRALFVRLWSLIGGNWQFNDYTYTAANTAAMTTPTQGSTLPPSLQTFQWSAGTGATQYYLWVGTTGVGSNNLDNIDCGTNLLRLVSNLPLSGGGTIYVRLWSLINGNWLSRDYTYSAAALAATDGR